MRRAHPTAGARTVLTGLRNVAVHKVGPSPVARTSTPGSGLPIEPGRTSISSPA